MKCKKILKNDALFHWIKILNNCKCVSVTKDICKYLGKNISKKVNGKYNQKLLDNARKYATDALKTAFKKY